MNRYCQPGFTIIEVMLFLAISGVMAIGLMAGMGAAISSQQYRDSVQSYADYLRGQYSKVVAVENERSGDSGATCPLAGSVTDRGRSNCVIVGRYTRTQDAGDKYESRSIYASQSGSSWSYALGEIDATYGTNWEAPTKIAGQHDGSAQVSLVIWRDPDMGYVRVALDKNQVTQDSLGDFLNSRKSLPASQADGEICIGAGSFLSGGRQSIFVSQTAGSGDAFRVGNAGEGCSA